MTERYLTRHERDAAVVVLTAVAMPFVAGFLAGLAGYSSVASGEYALAAFLFALGGVAYLTYRALRRLAGYGRRRWGKVSTHE